MIPGDSPHDRRGPPASGSGVLVRALVLKLVLVALLLAAADHYPSDGRYLAPREGDANDAVWVLARGFDANAYQRLALEGYYDDFSRNYPLGYPLLIRAAHLVTGNAQTAAVLVTNLCALLAVLVFASIAARYAERRGGRVATTTLLFCAMPGWLVFGTVAYSEGPWLLVALLAWRLYLKADDRAGPPAADGSPARRCTACLAAASLLFGASVMVRHAGATLLLGIGLIEGWRVLRASGAARGRAALEAGVALWVAVPVAAYLAWKYAAHDLGGLQERIWRMHVTPFGGLPSLIADGAAPEYIAQIYATLPLVVWLLWRARKVDGRLTVLGLVALVVLLSYTGTAAQSLMRYMWTLWPAALGALAIRDRGLVVALAALLFCLSVMIGAGHVLGTAAL